jgi:hypothetical protein
MYLQASLGDVDFITGDYLAEVNIAENAQAHAQGKHPGWEQTAWDGIEQTIDVLNEKRIKVVINGGAHNPKGLAEKVQDLVRLPYNYQHQCFRAARFHICHSTCIIHLPEDTQVYNEDTTPSHPPRLFESYPAFTELDSAKKQTNM